MRSTRDCRAMRRRVIERFDESLSIEDELRLERHLEECSRCRAHQTRIAALDEAIAHLPEPPTEHLDLDAALDAIHARTEQAGPTPVAGWPLKRVAAGIAAALLIALFATSKWRADSREATEVAQEEHRPEADVPRLPAPRVVTPAPPTDSAEIDLARLEDMREQVRSLMLECAAEVDHDADLQGALRLADLFDERSRHLRGMGWPRERLVTRLLEGDDAAAAGAAARYLGARGKRRSATALTRALARDDRRRSATLGLIDLGPAGLDGLTVALGDPELAVLALDGIAKVGGPVAAAVLAVQLRLDNSHPEPLLNCLASLGADAVEQLIELHLEGPLTTDRVAALLAPQRGAGAELARLLGERPNRARALALAEVAAIVDPLPAIGAIEELCLERETRERAVAILGSIAELDAVRALMRLRDTGRLPTALLDPAIEDSVGRNAPALIELAWITIDERDARAQSELLEFLVSSDSQGAAPALAVLADASMLDLELRRFATLAVGELGTREQLPELAALFGKLGPDERHLAAACLISMYALGGEQACAASLASGSARQRQDTLILLRRRSAKGRTTVSIFKLARELEPWLAARAQGEWNNTP